MSSIIEDTVAEALGKLGRVRAKFNGLEGVFTLLMEEHVQVATLLARAEISFDPEKRAELWAKIRSELLAHERAEAQTIYAHVATDPETAELARQHESEAEDLLGLIQNVDSSAFDSAQWEGCIKQVHEAVLRHARREEEHYFPQIQELVGAERAERLEQEYSEAKQALLSRV
jgi:hypothetical protein